MNDTLSSWNPDSGLESRAWEVRLGPGHRNAESVTRAVDLPDIENNANLYQINAYVVYCKLDGVHSPRFHAYRCRRL